MTSPHESSAPFRPAALVPAYRCAGPVGGVVRGLLGHLAEVLVVDDGSGDATPREALSAGARVLARGENGGKGRAIRDGLADLLERDVTHVAFVDADGQHDPDDLPALLSAARSGADFVVGSRLKDPATMPAKNFWANTIGDKVLSRMTGLPIEDGQSGYRVIASRLLRRLRLRANRYSIENEILIKVAPHVERFATVPVKTIYGPAHSHYRPFRDTWVTSWLSVYYKTLDSDAS
ncbi:MAG TPA: glycosyltransferase family 2 protein [Thermoanaerobaculia bacterium]|nr:glycosyltransferase family 2 protein [Thermoanaerobaculia bacterium]